MLLSAAERLVSAMLEEFKLTAGTEICRKLKEEEEEETEEEVLAEMRRLRESLLQELRRLLEERSQHLKDAALEPQQDSAVEGPPEVEASHQSDAAPGEIGQSEQPTPAAAACSGRTFSCPTCLKAFSARSSVRVHQLTVHAKQRPHGCSLCGKVFGTRGHLRTHRGSGAGRTLSCSACGETLPARCVLRRHRLTCQKTGGGFRCADCGKEFSKLRSGEFRALQLVS
ncbi:histone-lysine N-methyltransferase PRDM9-like [Perca flavescens]|uniref:histone-lysine N-methyltransferase PRDM9-like n=1 Tax=Perca flavescens TaxID=8167 RepID=UPI00106E50D1|nr:histone-lysine N-methyltransferase PRDM9-like [Perca flavescens]